MRLVTYGDACRAHNNMFPCARVHFERLIFPWTDLALGNCSYLDTCRHMKTCRYVHYQLDDQPDVMTSEAAGSTAKPKAAVPSYLAVSTCRTLCMSGLNVTEGSRCCNHGSWSFCTCVEKLAQVTGDSL